MRIVVTGATGYIGGQLIPRLLEADHEVRALVRDRSTAQGRPWAADVDLVKADLLDPATLEGVFDGVEVAYYLVNSMGSGAGFEGRDRSAAVNLANAAQGVGHLIYLGGLLPPGEVSSHLASRAEVGRILRERLPATEFRAGPIVGAGSGSFEMLRHLTERLPVMIAPRWVDNEVQPIAVEDVLAYLTEAAEGKALDVVEIGGADRVTFREMMLVYARLRGLRRLIVSVPVLTPRLAALWVGLVTPISNDLAIPLIEGIVRPVLADTGRAKACFPRIEPVGYKEAVRRAIAERGRRDALAGRA